MSSWKIFNKASINCIVKNAGALVNWNPFKSHKQSEENEERMNWKEKIIVK